MMKQKKHTQPAATQVPIFMNEEDGKWYFREKYLNDNHEIVYRVHPEGYDQMEDALRNSVNALNEFTGEMKKLQEQVKKTLSFAEELQHWYHTTFPSDSADAYAVLMAYTLFHYLLPNLGQTGEKTLEQVTWKDVEDIIARANGICVSSQPLVYKLLKSFFSHAMALDRIRMNPMQHVEPCLFKRPVKEFPSYTMEDVRKLLEEARYTVHFLEICLLLLGLRSGEIRGLRFTDFDENNGTLHIRRQAARQCTLNMKPDGTFSVRNTDPKIKTTKNETSDRILRVPGYIFTLVKERKEYLEDLKAKRLSQGRPWEMQYDGYVSIADFGRLKDENTVGCALKRICASAGIPNVSPHDLRHITATLMYEYGAEGNPDKEAVLKAVSRYLGHSSTNITIDVYMTHVESLSKIRQVSEAHQDPFLFASKTGGM